MYTEKNSPTTIKADKFVRDSLKTMLDQYTKPQRMLFKRMYSHGNLDATISDIVDNMPYEKLEWAVCQVENTLAKAEKQCK